MQDEVENSIRLLFYYPSLNKQEFASRREQGTGIVATAISAENIEIESAAAALPVPCSLSRRPHKLQFRCVTEWYRSTIIQ